MYLTWLCHFHFTPRCPIKPFTPSPKMAKITPLPEHLWKLFIYTFSMTDINGRFWRKQFFSLSFTFLRISPLIMVRFEKFKKWHTAESKPHIVLTLAPPYLRSGRDGGAPPKVRSGSQRLNRVNGDHGFSLLFAARSSRDLAWSWTL